jgi:hypothetical protein
MHFLVEDPVSSSEAILSTTQTVMAVALVVRNSLGPAMHSSPKKSPGASSVTVASLPPLETIVSLARPTRR